MEMYSETLKSRQVQPAETPLTTYPQPPSPPSDEESVSKETAPLSLEPSLSTHPFFATSPGPQDWRSEPLDPSTCFQGCTCDDDEPDPDCGCTLLTALVCRRADRVGNMIVIRQTVQNEEPRLLCVFGPFWPVLFFLTWPLVLGVSGYTFYRLLHLSAPIYVILVWCALTGALCRFLHRVSSRDPGILPRYREAPGERWRWNSQANTFRPPGAIYDKECGVIVEDFDHVCPWTGTAIGAGNMPDFQGFVSMICLMIIVDGICASGAWKFW
ncbi:hypothetical protein TrLO_g1507 [Triparma laevis f. longispina]|uniref:Palmitoyltransferase n=1 Tax=Triparma laevis f. longispina TaxID=1714387 RepID=A0A9W7E0X9_9STRA|nr:hypothetical protein TrLO_g1507 [Triparma laevis f. longispina]